MLILSQRNQLLLPYQVAVFYRYMLNASLSQFIETYLLFYSDWCREG